MELTVLPCLNPHDRTLSALLAGFAIGIAPCTQAAYYVEDDAPATVVSTAAMLAPPSITRGTALTTFSIPFYVGHDRLGQQGKQSVHFLLPTLSAAPLITIQGRPDPVNPGNIDLAHRRALSIKRYLRDKGLSNPITIEVATDVQSADPPNVYNATIVLAPPTPPAPPPRTAYYPPVDPATSHQVSAEAVRRALKIAADANLSSTDTATLVASLLPGTATTGDTPVPYAPLRTPVGDGALPVALSRLALSPNTSRRQWWLDASKTLRDNLEEWARTAGWNPIRWEASNFYEVTSTVPVEGDFPGVLRQVADSTGLNICARKSDRTIKVTEGNVNCRE